MADSPELTEEDEQELSDVHDLRKEFAKLRLQVSADVALIRNEVQSIKHLLMAQFNLK